VLPTDTVKLFAWYFENPGLVTSTEYPAAGAKEGALKMPAPVVSTDRLMPFDSLMIITEASGTVLPEGSRTTPAIPPIPACENKLAAHSDMRVQNCITLLFDIKTPTL
jgi:hypothetical protein